MGRETFPAVSFVGPMGVQFADFHRLDDSEEGVVDQVPTCNSRAEGPLRNDPSEFTCNSPYPA